MTTAQEPPVLQPTTHSPSRTREICLLRRSRARALQLRSHSRAEHSQAQAETAEQDSHHSHLVTLSSLSRRSRSVLLPIRSLSDTTMVCQPCKHFALFKARARSPLSWEFLTDRLTTSASKESDLFLKKS